MRSFPILALLSAMLVLAAPAVSQRGQRPIKPHDHRTDQRPIRQDSNILNKGGGLQTNLGDHSRQSLHDYGQDYPGGGGGGAAIEPYSRGDGVRELGVYMRDFVRRARGIQKIAAGQ